MAASGARALALNGPGAPTVSQPQTSPSQTAHAQNRTALDRTLTGNYRIPRDKAKGFMHWAFKTQSRSEINKGAVRECLANDLMAKMGVHSQKLKMIPTQWN